MPIRQRNRRQKLRNFFWPDMGWRRLIVYYRHRMGRLPGTAYFIAGGFAIGFGVSFTPFIGFHLLLGLALCWALRASVMGMVVGTVMGGNPWTFPFIWVGTYKLGLLLLGGQAGGDLPPPQHSGFSFAALMDKPMELLLPMTLGSLPLGLAAALASFYAVRHAVRQYKQGARVKAPRRAKGGQA